jgi:hypothetical protein
MQSACNAVDGHSGRVPDAGCNQRPSEATRGHQRLSEVIRGYSEAIRGHQRVSEVIQRLFRGYQGPSEVISAPIREQCREDVAIGRHTPNAVEDLGGEIGRRDRGEIWGSHHRRGIDEARSARLLY